MGHKIIGGFLHDTTPGGIISLATFQDSTRIRLVGLFVLFMVPITYFYHSTRSRTRGLAPLINPKGPLELTHERPRKEFIANARGIIHSWFKAHPNSPARVNGDVGEYTILPPHMMGQVDREDLVSLTRWAYKVSC